MKTNKSKSIRLALLTAFMSGLMLLNYSCDTTDDEFCDKAEDICEEPVTVCSSSTEDYYVYKGDTVYCITDSCTMALDSIMSMCTYSSLINNDIEIRNRLQEIMTRIRLLSE